jgi:cytochrome c oxidase subunit 3
MKKIFHPFHLVDNSPWPFIVSITLLNFILSLIFIRENKIGHIELFYWTFFSLLLSIFSWVLEIIIEGTYKGLHTKKVQIGLYIGFILFVISEISIFLSFFIAHLNSSLIPSIELGNVWPPIGIENFNPEAIPLFNTLLLFFSGLCSTISQNFLSERNKKKSIFYLILTLLFGITFSFEQYKEYLFASYTISDSVYASNFYILTGFHGIHVILGTFLLLISLLRLIQYHFSTNHHLGFTTSTIYWHFVDYVWLILYTIIYCWGY